MKIITQRLLVSLFMLVLFAACSRPVAYFQPTAREQFTTTPMQPEQVSADNVSASVVGEVSAPANPAQANATFDQVDAVVRNDSELAADKTVQKRLNRIQSLLTAAPAKTSMTSTVANAPQKMNFMERLLLKKLNKKISRQLAPNHPAKPMANTGVLVAGAILVILGLVLLIAGSSSTVSIILILAGAVVLLVGLL